MATQHLKQALIELRTALASGEPLDPEFVELLKVLDADIHETLARHDEMISDAGLTARAQEISARFAAEHPHLEPVLRELTNTLNRIGI